MPVTGHIKPDDATAETLATEASKTPDGLYRWCTVGDERVRPEHAAFEGDIRAWSDSTDPGEDANCRCWAEEVNEDSVPDEIEPVYPEFWLGPLVGVRRLYYAWKLWSGNKNTEWTLGKFKSEMRWANQLRDRDWSPKQITNTITHGKKFDAPNKVNPTNTATRYEYEDRFVVRDDQTGEVLQVSGSRFTPNEVIK